VLLQGLVLCNITYGKGTNFIDLFWLGTRNRTSVTNYQIIPNPTLNLLVQCLSNCVPRNPGVRCFTSIDWFGDTVSMTLFPAGVQKSCSFTHMQLAAYSTVCAVPVSERIPRKMFKHREILLTAELGTTPACKQSIRQSMLMLEHYTWHSFFPYENNAFDFLCRIVFPGPVWVSAVSFKPKTGFVMK
jgi:hypothetical protein